MERYHGLSPEEQTRITDIQDLLIELYVEQKKELEEGEQARAREIEFEIKELKREMETIKEWAKA